MNERVKESWNKRIYEWKYTGRRNEGIKEWWKDFTKEQSNEKIYKMKPRRKEAIYQRSNEEN
jgi:hypothetical protein